MIETYLIAIAAIAIAQITPGPNLLAVAGVALNQGRRTAFMVTLGVATAIFVWVLAMASGLGAIITLYPGLLTAMKFVGGGYLCFLALKALRAALRGEGASIGAKSLMLTPFAAWRMGVLVNLTNPKSAMMWAAVATFMLGSGLTPVQVMVFAPMGFATATLIYGTYGMVFSSGVARTLYARFARAMEAVFGVAFGAVGGGLLLGGVRDLAK